jgi:predicted Ser/Thr protein kinase
MTTRFGRCRVVEEIGSGALSTVYKAVQEPLGRTVAVKALRSTIATSSPFAALLEREAKVLGELAHPNVISLHDFAKSDSELYLVLEYIDGKSLAELLGRKKRFLPDTVAAVGSFVARGLEHVHGRGFVHRDVKPANILLSKSGEVKLVDFGIAQGERLTDVEEAPASSEASAFGTPAYMSPEQILGEFVDARSDLFSLGIVLYEMIAEIRPFDGDDEPDGRTTAQRIRRDPPKLLRARAPDVPRSLERVIMRLLEKLPADRFASAAALADELDEIVRATGRRPARSLVVRALKEAGFTEITTPFGAYSEASRGPESPPTHQTLIGFGALLLLIVLGGGMIQEGARGSADATDSPLEGTPSGRTGSLRVVVTPWADIWIDGRFVDTTPFARAIPLPAGTHFVKLLHPAADTETRTVRIAEGEQLSLAVNMRLNTPPAAASSSPDEPQPTAPSPTPPAPTPTHALTPPPTLPPTPKPKPTPPPAPAPTPTPAPTLALPPAPAPAPDAENP